MKTQELTLMVNPIHELKAYVPVFVWTYYSQKFGNEIALLELSKNDESSLRTTFANYHNGIRKATSLYSCNFRFREVMEKAFPIQDTRAFFNGDVDEMQAEAHFTAKRMIGNYENLYNNQKRAIA